MSLSDNGETQVLDEIFNAGAGTFPSGDPYIQLHNGDPGEAGTTNIVDIPRVQAAFGSASGNTLSNTGNIDFTTMPAVGAPGVVAWSIWDSADATPTTPAGACFWTGWFSTVGKVCVCIAADVTANTIQSPAHGLTTDDRVVFEAIEGESLPTGLSAGTLYWVISTGLTVDVFEVSTTQGGGAVDITAKGVAIARKVVGKTTNSGDTFRIATGDLDIYID